MTNIDYLTISLGGNADGYTAPPQRVLEQFAAILPNLYRRTCKDAIFSAGTSQRVSQYGLCASLQYGTALERGWAYSVQLSGDYWHAIEYDREAVLQILSHYPTWRISRLDLERTATVPLPEWQAFCRAAFDTGYNITGAGDGRTAYLGSRISQFYTRIYNKTSADPTYYPAPDGYVQVRYEIEIKRVRGEQVLKPAFFDPDFAHRLYLQRVHLAAEQDSTGFLMRYFGDESSTANEKIKTVKRLVGNLEDTVNYVFSSYAKYFAAGMHSQLIADRYEDITHLDDKSQKILSVLDSELYTNPDGLNESFLTERGRDEKLC